MTDQKLGLDKMNLFHSGYMPLFFIGEYSAYYGLGDMRYYSSIGCYPIVGSGKVFSFHLEGGLWKL